VTDLDKSYPKILDELFGENLYHQPCLFHLLQLICKTFSKNCSMYEEFLKFTLLNVFYDHSVQLEWLIEKVNEEKEILASKSKNEYKLWLKSAKKDFVQLTKQIEKKQRIDGIDTMIRNFDEILSQFVDVLENIEMYPPLLQKRIKMIDENFVKLTTFCESDIIPPTNNATENYFFRTLNMGWKKRMKTDRGLINHLKLQFMRITNYWDDKKTNLIHLFCGLYSLQIIS